MKRIAVFIATTAGPVRVERITRERAPQSMVCLKRTSTVLPISPGYDGFVRPGSGIVERSFGPFEDGAFRLDLSAPIESGESWQLGVFVAHAVDASSDSALAPEQDADEIVWLTGQVDCDLAVGSVGHIAEKLHASRAALASWLAAERPVTLFVGAGEDHAALVAAGVPEGAGTVALSSAQEALSALGLGASRAQLPQPIVLPAPIRNPRRAPVRWIASSFAASAAAAVALTYLAAAPHPPVPIAVPPPAERPNPQPAARESPRELPAPQPKPQSQETPALKVAVPLAAPAAPAPPPHAPAKLALLERRAPPGRSCADVQFGAAPALETPAPAEGELSISTLHGLCGIALSIDNGDEPGYAAVMLNLMSGKLLYGTTRPDAFNGQMAFAGRQEWVIDLPRRLPAPFEFRAIAITGRETVADQAVWLADQPTAAAALQTLSAKGLATAMLHHRVVP